MNTPSFALLTLHDGSLIRINMNQITSYRDGHDGYGSIVEILNVPQHVIERPDQIDALFEQAYAARIKGWL